MSFTIITKEDYLSSFYFFSGSFLFYIILNMFTNRFNIKSFGDYAEYQNYTIIIDMYQQTITDFIFFTK